MFKEIVTVIFYQGDKMYLLIPGVRELTVRCFFTPILVRAKSSSVCKRTLKNELSHFASPLEWRSESHSYLNTYTQLNNI